VITGGPGFGKTTILRELSEIGFPVEEEAALHLILRTLGKPNPVLPWIDREAFDRELENLMRKSYYRAKPGITFYDRGIPDFIGWNLHENRSIDHAIRLASSFPYDRLVFLTAPNPAFHVMNELRPFTFEQSWQINNRLREGYERVGYEVRQLPIENVNSLARLIVQQAKERVDHQEGDEA
jgi:predicted ATPase